MASAVEEIQQALEVIRAATEEADWKLRLEILELMLSTSESVVAHARKLAEPEVVDMKRTVIVPKTRVVKRYVDAEQQVGGKQKRTDVDDGARLRQQKQQLAAVKPQAALPNQRAV